jgi:hypothetical protein
MNAGVSVPHCTYSEYCLLWIKLRISALSSTHENWRCSDDLNQYRGFHLKTKFKGSYKLPHIYDYHSLCSQPNTCLKLYWFSRLVAFPAPAEFILQYDFNSYCYMHKLHGPHGNDPKVAYDELKM